MNIQELEILKQLSAHAFSNQRNLADSCRCSLGMINRCLKSLEALEYLTGEKQLTPLAVELLKENKPQQAVILAAGYGLRMVPINMEQPKALIRVNGEVLIERLIRQLHAVGVREIYVVVGFMKEQFEYLIDQFGVKLIVNRDYASSNNLHSLFLAKEHLENAYILPCDIWCRENPFSANELYSWYMVKDSESCKSEVRINRKQELARIEKGQPGNPMVGISYITAENAPELKNRIEHLANNSLYEQAFWEEALYQDGKMTVFANEIPAENAVEINTYEQLRELDSNSAQLENQAITTACEALQAEPSEIREITVLKKGMTNRSFLFTCRNQKYIMRIPGEGTDQLINRREEASVYSMIRGKKLCDDIVYMSPENGYKITRFIEGARCCDPANEVDLKRCMMFLKQFHGQRLKVGHEFDIYGKIEFYESLWNGQPSAYRDYEKTKQKVYDLRAFIDAHREEKVLTHIDAVPDNFLLFQDVDGEKKIRLIDWECAAMQDPHVDIAMFGIHALYGKKQMDRLIDIYFEGSCPELTRVKIYCYVAVCGLMWSNWCEYQMQNGAEFGEYSLKQYRYAKEFYRYAAAEIPGLQCYDNKENQI